MSNLKKMRMCVCMCVHLCLYLFVAESLKAHPAAGKLPKATWCWGGKQWEGVQER